MPRAKPPACPWQQGAIFRHDLDGRRIFLHLFSLREVPVFLVLDWSLDTLPSDAELAEVQPKSGLNLWKFQLILPRLERRETLEAWQARLEAVLEPTGRTLASHRSPIPCELILWEKLDEHLRKNWQW